VINYFHIITIIIINIIITNQHQTSPIITNHQSSPIIANHQSSPIITNHNLS